MKFANLNYMRSNVSVAFFSEFQFFMKVRFFSITNSINLLINSNELSNTPAKFYFPSWWAHWTSIKKLNAQAPVTPELPTRWIFRLSRLSVNTYSKTVTKYTPQFEYRGFFEIIYFFVKRLWNSQNVFENFRLRLFILWCLPVFFFIFGVCPIQFVFNPSQRSF